jgi:hypothetical protein
MELTIEQLVELQKIEKHLDTALNHHFISGLNIDDMRIAGNVWNQTMGKYEGLNFACNSCAMNVFSKLARFYYDQKYKLDEKIIKEENEIDINSTEKISDNIGSEEIERKEIKEKKGRTTSTKGRTTSKKRNY